MMEPETEALTIDGKTLVELEADMATLEADLHRQLIEAVQTSPAAIARFAASGMQQMVALRSKTGQLMQQQLAVETFAQERQGAQKAWQERRRLSSLKDRHAALGQEIYRYEQRMKQVASHNVVTWTRACLLGVPYTVLQAVIARYYLFEQLSEMEKENPHE